MLRPVSEQEHTPIGLEVHPVPEDVRLHITSNQPLEVTEDELQGDPTLQQPFEAVFMSSLPRLEAAVPGMDCPDLDIKRVYIYTHARIRGRRSLQQRIDPSGNTIGFRAAGYEEFRGQGIIVVPEELAEPLAKKIPKAPRPDPIQNPELFEHYVEQENLPPPVSPAALLFRAIANSDPGWVIGGTRPVACAVYSQKEGWFTLVDAVGGFNVGVGKDGAVTEEQLQSMSAQNDQPAPQPLARTALRSQMVA